MIPKQENDRKRGGQLGNHNAFKHGFYSEQFKQAERGNLGKIQETDLAGEIEVLRVEIRRYLEAENAALDQIDYDTRLQSLRAVSLAADSLSRLIRTQALINANLQELGKDQEINQTLDDNSG